MAPDKSVVKRTLGIELANISDDLRKRYKIKDSVKGIVITGIDANSPAADKRLSPGDVIANEQQMQPTERVEIARITRTSVAALASSPHAVPWLVGLTFGRGKS
jgi:serine protease Do